MTATVLFLPGGGIPAGRRVTEGGDGGAWLGCVLRGVGLVDTPVLRDKRVFRWCTVGCLGQHWLFLLGPHVGWPLVVVGCVWGCVV